MVDSEQDNPYYSPGEESNLTPHDLPMPSSGRSIGRIILTWTLILGGLLVLVAMLIPARRGGRESARRNGCTNNVKQIATALHAYHEKYQSFPPAYTVDASGKPLHSWRALILPFIEEEYLYRLIDFTKPWDDPANAKARETQVPCYVCPSADSAYAPLTTYFALVGPECFFPGEGRTRTLKDIKDGTSKTVAIFEVPEANAVHWMSPVDGDTDLFVRSGELGAETIHTGSVQQLGWGDGHVSSIRPGDCTPEQKRALATIAGGESAPAARE